GPAAALRVGDAEPPAVQPAVAEPEERVGVGEAEAERPRVGHGDAPGRVAERAPAGAELRLAGRLLRAALEARAAGPVDDGVARAPTGRREDDGDRVVGGRGVEARGG